MGICPFHSLLTFFVKGNTILYLKRDIETCHSTEFQQSFFKPKSVQEQSLNLGFACSKLGTVGIQCIVPKLMFSLPEGSTPSFGKSVHSRRPTRGHTVPKNHTWESKNSYFYSKSQKFQQGQQELGLLISPFTFTDMRGFIFQPTTEIATRRSTGYTQSFVKNRHCLNFKNN